jgi:sugar lactone lactonase YvrE
MNRNTQHNAWGRLARAGRVAVFASLACLAAVAGTAFAATALLGPAQPTNDPTIPLPVIPLGPANFVSAGTYSVSPGATWTFNSGVTLATKTTVYHAALPNMVRLSFNGAFGGPGETLTYNAAGSSAAGGIVQYIGSTNYFGTSNTRVTLTYTTNGVTPIALVTAASIGANPAIGLLAPVPAAGFVVNYYAEAQNPAYGFPSFTAAKTVYDAIHLANGQVAQTLLFDFTAGFYWNDVPPVLATNTGMTVSQGSTTAITSAMLQATDVEDGPAQLTFTIPTSGGGPPHNGALKKIGVGLLVGGSTFTQDDINNKLVSYQNDNSCNTSDDFQFSVSDSNGAVIPPPPGPPSVFSFPITVTLPHLAPTANPGSISVPLGGTGNGTLTATNNDCYAPTWTFAIATQGTKGTATVTNASTGAFTFTATPGQVGADSFTFTANNGSVTSAPATITVTIQNQPPVAQDQTVNTNEGAPIPGTLVATDPDLPAQPLTYSMVTNGTKGTAGITNPATGAFIYVPNPGRMGFDSFTFKANDGTLDSNVGTVTVNIRPNMTSGRIVTTGTGPQGGSTPEVLLVDPVTADQGVVTSGGFLAGAATVAIESTGKILALDNSSGSLIRIDPVSGGQTPLATGLPGFPLGVAVEPSGSILLALGPAGISRRDPATGAQTASFTAGLNGPISVTVAHNGDIYTGDTGLFAPPAQNRIMLVDPVTGTPTPVSTGGSLMLPIGVALDAANTTLYVADAPDLFIGGTSVVLSIPVATGVQTPVASGGSLAKTAGITVAGDGTLLTSNAAGSGAIVRVNPAGGAQTPVSSGGELNGVFGIAVVSQAPALVGVVSRKLHSTAGTFDLALSLVAPPAINHNPTTEPRSGPAQTLVFQFDKPVISGNAAISEGVATLGTPTFSGNEMTVPLTGVTNKQYVTVDVSSVAAADGGSGGSGSARVGLLVGNVTGSRQVLPSDVGLVRSHQLENVGPTNFQYSVTLGNKVLPADVGITRANQLQKLPTP